MSENIPSGTSSSSSPPPPPLPLLSQPTKQQIQPIPSPTATALPSQPKRSSKRKFDKGRLPTPPPPPPPPELKNDDKVSKEDFIAYLDSLGKSSMLSYSRSTSTFAQVIAAEDAFDHLEKLYKLMEQMLELRDQNSKLHRRLRDLEHLNNLEKMHKKLNIENDYPELGKDTAFAETILESILADTKPPKSKSGPSRLRQSISRRQRHRSGSATDKVITLEPEMKEIRRASTCVDNRESKPAKVSKWTKVKAAFKWEKASPTVSDAKSQDSGIGGMIPNNLEVARYLRVPSTSEDTGHSPSDSGAAEISTPGSLSTASSTEDFHRNVLRSPCEDLRSSDDEHSHSYIPRSKEGSQKSTKSHRTPWAKMKDMIQTRNSFKKKHRLSSQSDDIQIDIEFCSDNEDVFEDDKSKSPQTPSPCAFPKVYTRVDSNEIPPDVIERYQKYLLEEDGNAAEPKKISKWTRVKKAFLPPDDQNQQANNIKDDINNINNAHAEIQKNYKDLQQKLSLEFQEKLNEWERLKQSSPSTSSPPASFSEDKDAFIKKMEEWQKIKSQPSKSARTMMLTSSCDLPPEFKKKLQEWEKIKKTSHREIGTKKKLCETPRWKSLSGSSHSQQSAFEYPQITEDFKKKLEEWRQIKAGNAPEVKTSSPVDSKKEYSPKHSKKQKDHQEKELQWVEKELGKIEKEKQRLERERQKFLEREERLSKLRNSVIGSIKKDILIHTPSGFHKFEGISRKFTQKLYEWEKAQGIGPESSTFALLSSPYTTDLRVTTAKTTSNTPPLTRSKSADSIAVSALNLTCPLMSHQPSSLSLNDVENLEKECLADSKSSSMQFSHHSHESLQDEPEALIVEVEDIIEETAAPLQTPVAQKSQQPVYQREELREICESETCIGPKVRRSESTRAQTNYNLIEEVFSLLANLTEAETEIQKLQDSLIEKRNDNKGEVLLKLKDFNESQLAMSSHLLDKITKLQDANNNVVTNIMKIKSKNDNILDVLEAVQDNTTESLNLVEQLDIDLNSRNVYEVYEAGARACSPIDERINDIRNKMVDLRRNLSYVCAASDLTTPKSRRSKKLATIDDYEREKPKERLYIKADTSNVSSQGAIKKRIKYRQKTSVQNCIVIDSDEEETSDKSEQRKKKLIKTRSTLEGALGKVDVEKEVVKEMSVSSESKVIESDKFGDSPVTLFVKTTRKLFTPLVESSKSVSPTIETSVTSSTTMKLEKNAENNEKVTSLPPLPVSPALQRKVTKEISPSIRLMLAKYNQKISEQEPPPIKSGGSSGSASPVAWRSPSAERRVKVQTEKYQKEINKLSPLTTKREVQKSASTVNVSNKTVVSEVTKSSSATLISGTLSTTPKVAVSGSLSERKGTNLKVNIPQGESTAYSRHSPEIRQKKLQKAKEEFLKSSPISAPPAQSQIRFPSRNRLSQISVDSESSFDMGFNGALIKSASAGMINIDADSYKQFDPEIHKDGYVSLPRNKKGLLSSKFAFSNIASKFRKVRMRKGKDKDKDKDKDKEKDNRKNAVEVLCRQSLIVDIKGEETSSEDVSASSSKSIWMKRFFK